MGCGSCAMTARSCIARSAEKSVAGASAGSGAGGPIKAIVRNTAPPRMPKAINETMVGFSFIIVLPSHLLLIRKKVW